MITIDTISKVFETKTSKFHALRDVSLNVREGSIHGVIGPSGAGKSTLIRTINALESYDSGRIDVLGYQDIKKLNKESTRMLRKKIGMIFQNFNLLDRQNVFDNIAFPIKLDRKLTDDDHRKIEGLIEIVGLKGYENSYPSQLSGGQKQRVGIARVLVNEPKLLLCDEPTSALDTSTIKSILHLLKSLRDTHGLTIIIVTHDMNVIKEVCDVVTVMDKGGVVESNIIDNIIYNPQHDITKSLLDTIGFNLEELVTRFKDYPNLCLLKFNKEAEQQALISNMSIEFSVKINILYANITAKNRGIMLVSIDVTDLKNLDQLNVFFERNEVETRYVR